MESGCGSECDSSRLLSVNPALFLSNFLTLSLSVRPAGSPVRTFPHGRNASRADSSTVILIPAMPVCTAGQSQYDRSDKRAEERPQSEEEGWKVSKGVERQ